MVSATNTLPQLDTHHLETAPPPRQTIRGQNISRRRNPHTQPRRGALLIRGILDLAVRLHHSWQRRRNSARPVPHRGAIRARNLGGPETGHFIRVAHSSPPERTVTDA